MVAALHAAGIEVILDIVPNHTAEGGVGGTTLSYRGLDAPAYYSLGGNGHDADITGTGNTLDSGSPTVIRLVCDAMRHWVTGHRRRRLPDRPGQRARPAALRPVRPERAAAHGDRGRPGAVAREADRRAVGRHRRGLPGRRVRRGVVGVERALPRRRARLLARPRQHRRGRVPAHRQLRPLPALRAAAVGVDQLRHRARRLHPARPGLLRAQAQRGQRRGQPRRHRRQPLAELRRRGRDRLPGDRAARRLATARAMLGTLLLSTGTPDAARRATSCGAPSAATTTPTASTTRRPGWTGRTAPTASLAAFTARVAAIRHSSPALQRDRFYRDGEVLWWHPSGRRLGGHDWHDADLHTPRAAARRVAAAPARRRRTRCPPPCPRAARTRRSWTAPAPTASRSPTARCLGGATDHPPAPLAAPAPHTLTTTEVACAQEMGLAFHRSPGPMAPTDTVDLWR